MNRLLSSCKRCFFRSYRGDAGIAYIVLIMVLLIALAGYMVGGVPKFKQPSHDAQQYELPETENAPKSNTSSMQLRAVAAKKKPPQRVKNKNKNNNSNENSNDTTTPENPSNQTPTATTAPPQACSNIAVDFLVDESGSMLSDSKMTRLKFALKEYIRTLPATALVAIHSFAEPPQAAKEEQAFVEIGPVRDNVLTKIDASLNPNDDWATYMREGFKLAQSRLNAQKQARPDRKYFLVLISDGVPELDKCQDRTTLGGECELGENENDIRRNYDLSQDPTHTGLGQPNIPSQIKQSGVTIYSIGIFTEDDQAVNRQLETLLRNIASSPSNYLRADDAGQLTTIFSQLSQNICR